MQTDASNVLSDLITLSKNADQIISDSNFGNEQVGQWFSIIKETAVAIAKGTYAGKSTGTEKSSAFCKDDLPSLVTLIKGKQNSHRLSALLAVQNRVHLSHRKSRKSLRKVILRSKSGNQWKISNRKSSSGKNIQEDESKSSSPQQDEDLSSTPKIKDKLLESQFKTPLDVSKNKSAHSKSYFAELQSSVAKTSQIDYSTPIHQNKEILVPNTDETTPATRSKLKFAVGATEVIKQKNIPFSSQNSLFSEAKTPTPINCNAFSNKYEKTTSQFLKKADVAKDSTESDEFLTPENKTIIIDSDCSAEKNKYVSPVTRSKRKSSAQHTQENAKKIKASTSSVSQVPTGKSSKWDDNFKGNNAFKQINSVIPGKILHQQNVHTPSEKRILREIQKKEEKITQNTKKLKSLQLMKIEENKKAREKKMEKAMQQRMKIEKEKEERLRSRTQSKQENLQQTECTSKKGAHKKAEAASVIKKPEDKSEPPRKPLRSPIKKVRISPVEQKSPKSARNIEVNKTYLHDPSPKEITNSILLNTLNSTYVRSSPAEVQNSSTPPPKPIRNVNKPKETSDEKRAEAFKKPLQESSSSTPASKKIQSKTNIAKTPVSNNAKKPNSYSMTPHESSFVSYDISEIKSDDSDEEEEVNQKPIPTWASGINLRTALLNQHYAPINVDELFGNYFESPVLAEIMGMEKRHYNKRTSSAIWLDSPNRSRT